MNKEIKFRAITVKTGKWVYFDLRDLEAHIPEQFIWDTVGEYTGLKDKNGVEIYDGDIVKWKGADEVYEVLWAKGGARFWACQGTVSTCCREIGTYSGEVIGNIYRNKELLTN